MLKHKLQAITLASIIAGCIIPNVPYFSSSSTLYLNKQQYTAGEQIQLSIDLTQLDHPDAQLELYHVDQDFHVAEHLLVDESTLDFTSPQIPGHYEFRITESNRIIAKRAFTITSADIRPVLSMPSTSVLTHSQLNIKIDLQQQFQLPLTATLMSGQHAIQSWSITDETPIQFSSPKHSGQYRLQLSNQAHKVLETLPFKTFSPRQYPAISLNSHTIKGGDLINATISVPKHITFGDLWIGLHSKTSTPNKDNRISWKKASQEQIQLYAPSIAGQYTLALIDRDANFIVDQASITIPNSTISAFQLDQTEVDQGEKITLSANQQSQQHLWVSVHALGQKDSDDKQRWSSAKSPLQFDAPSKPGKYLITIYNPEEKFRKIGELPLTVSAFKANAVLALNKGRYTPSEAMLATIRNLKPNGDMMWIEIIKNKKIHTIHYLAPQLADTVALSIPAPVIEGQYQAYLVTNPNQTKRHLGIDITISEHQQQNYALNVTQENHSSLISVNYQHPKAILHRHWVGLYNTLTDKLISWQALPKNKGILRFASPNENGHFEFRLMSNQQAKLSHSIDLKNDYTPKLSEKYLSVLIQLKPEQIMQSKVYIGKMNKENQLTHVQQVTLADTKTGQYSDKHKSKVKFLSPEKPGDYVFWLEQSEEQTPYLNSIYPFKLTSSQSLVYNPGMAQNSLTLDRENLVVLYK